MILIMLMISVLDASAQSFQAKYIADDGDQATLFMNNYGIVVNYRGNKYAMSPVGIHNDGFTYAGNGAQILLSFMGEKFVLAIGDRIIDTFTIDPSSSQMSGGFAAPSNGYSNGGGNSEGATYRQTCSFCNGRGWRAGFSTPTYGNTGTHYCSECGKEVGASHSHDHCPSCMGRGYIEKIR